MQSRNPIIRYLYRMNRIDDYFQYSVYMRFAAGLSFFNSAMLLAQRDGVGFAATETTWRNRFGREVKPGANPLIIIKPFAPVDLYFEACDTYSPDDIPLPDWVAVDFSSVLQVHSIPFDVSYTLLIRLLNNHGVQYDEREMGGRSHGIMAYCEAPIWMKVYRKKTCEHIQTHYAMVVNAKCTPVEKAAAIFHEIGHLLCGHLPLDEKLMKHSWLKLSIPKRETESLSVQQEEYEAETACMLIMNGLGFAYDRSAYLNDYLVDGQPPEYDLGMSIAAADQFLSWLRGDPELRRQFPFAL